MTNQILELEAQLREVRAERDAAMHEVKTIRESTTKTHYLVARSFVEDLRRESRARRSHPFEAFTEYVRWLSTAADSTGAYIAEFTDGDVRTLASAELRLLVANHKAFAINRDLTRLRRVISRLGSKVEMVSKDYIAAWPRISEEEAAAPVTRRRAS